MRGFNMICPKCGSDDVCYDEVKWNDDNSRVTFLWYCGDCDCDWDDTYELIEHKIVSE